MADGLIEGPDGLTRCWWPGTDPLYVAYHDTEWGRPVADDRTLFEKICLEGFQSGLSWITILRKRDNFRRVFANFEIEEVARFGDREVEAALADAGIVRHAGKIRSVINNAHRARALQDEAGSIAAFVWGFEPDPETRPTSFDKATLCAIASSPQSNALSKALRKRGWSFVGPTTVYAFMQAMGLVNDHLDGCAFRAEVEAARTAFVRPR